MTHRIIASLPTMTAVAALLVFGGSALAAPEGGNVVAGSATISQSGNTTNVNQSSQKTIINWQKFSIAPAETVNFNQPNASAVALNRVIGNERSIIEGALNANGQVFLINSAGVVIGKGASVNTAGFVASTRDIADSDFMSGKYTFSGHSNGEVVNLGTITVTPGGYVSLLGKAVSNQGVITATRGTVALAGGDKVALNFGGDSLIDVAVDQGTLDALVENKSAIYADGGKVILTAKAADDLLSALVINTGLVQARTLGQLTGEITLYAHGGTTQVDGTLDASAPDGGNGGFVETSGDVVNVASGAKVRTLAAEGKTGSWLIDPNDFTIAASGGNMTAADVVSNLATTNFEIKTATMGASGGNGDIFINQTLAWGTDQTLTLTAQRNVNINQSVTATGDSAGLTLNAGTDINVNAPVTLSGDHAALAMTYGGDYNIRTKASYSGAVLDANGDPTAKQDTSGGVYGSITLNGANSTLKINNQDYILIHDLTALATTGTRTGYYALAQDLTSLASNYATGSVVGTFSGTLAGLGHTISGINISASSKQNVGLIGQVTAPNTTLRDIGLVGVNITGSKYAGALLGTSAGTNLRISGVYSTGTVSAGSYVGGLLGWAKSSSTNTITNSYSDAAITGGTSGGLVGSVANTVIRNSHATGNVAGDGGGLAGVISQSSIENSYATGAVTGSATGTNVGGLIGQVSVPDSPYAPPSASSVSNSFATGNVSGGTNVGGLIGGIGTTSTNPAINPYSVTTVSNTYATGDVTARNYNSSNNNQTNAGGLIGYANYTNITRSHAMGDVTVAASIATSIGGLVGWFSNGTIDQSYATGDVIGHIATQDVGGLVGTALGTVSNSYATGNVVGGNQVGGLAGRSSSIENSWASGNVTGDQVVGGLVGSAGDVADSWASGNVTGSDVVGGLAGMTSGSGTVRNSWASGAVSGGSRVGGLVGQLKGGLVNSYWNVDTTGQRNAVGEMIISSLYHATMDNVQGLTSGQFQDIQHYVDGTIDQVLANRAAAAAAEAAHQAKVENAVTTATSVVSSTQSSNGAKAPSPQAVDGGAASQTAVESNIVVSGSAGYSADVSGVQVDGVHYDLNSPGSASGNAGNTSTTTSEDEKKDGGK
jgi:filamentous haemagglutinin family N-terminal domain